MNSIKSLTHLVKKAKIQRNPSMLQSIHEHILEMLVYLQSFRQSHKGIETSQIKDEITQLERLNLLVYRAFGDICRNEAFRMRHINQNKIKGSDSKK